MFKQQLFRKYMLVVGIICSALLFVGCGNSKQTMPAQPKEVAVKAVTVVQKDTPVVYEYVGEVTATEQVELRSRISGIIVEKLVTGGAAVHQGQPLFRIDSRTYQAAVLTRQGNMAEASADYNRAALDLIRYRKLAKQGAISQQELDNAEAAAQQAAARVETGRGMVEQTEADLADTLITSPIDGRIDIKDLSVGNYVDAGKTVLGNICSVDPVWVKFSMSETEHLRFMRMGNGQLPSQWEHLTLYLSDGTDYGLEGRVTQINSVIAQNTGTINLQAIFPNDQNILVPGMFVRVRCEGEFRKNAMLIPQRAVQEMLGKSFVTVVGEGNKAESRAVKLGPHVGNLCVVQEGLQAGDCIVIEGFQKAQPGTPLKVSMVTIEDLSVKADK
ncbi:efflux RND transporter periplasmic adaptor subunit [Sporomusa ovata]|uniref:efflux RND transporter periplasmic adaptor subunit n=1 Tax=Sporomusa ovata TaxID=2378 RepID=UPI00048DF2C4|nr:efflux RND transporter periplasmic adaptor subunit [Sporomusa ovata]